MIEFYFQVGILTLIFFVMVAKNNTEVREKLLLNHSAVFICFCAAVSCVLWPWFWYVVLAKKA